MIQQAVIPETKVQDLHRSVLAAESAIKDRPIPMVNPFGGDVVAATVQRNGMYSPPTVFLHTPREPRQLVMKFEIEGGKVVAFNGQLQRLNLAPNHVDALSAAFHQAADRAKHPTAPVYEINDLLAERGQLPPMYNPYEAHHRRGTIDYLSKLIRDHGRDGSLTVQIDGRTWLNLHRGQGGSITISRDNLDRRDVLTAGTSVTIAPDRLHSGGYVETRMHGDGSVSRGLSQEYLWSQGVSMIRTIEDKLGVRYPVA